MSRLQYFKDVATLELNQDKCTGCQQCLQVCPQNVLGRKERVVEILHRDNCMECGACQLNCAFAAITVNAGVGCAAAIIGSIFNSAGGCDC